MIKRAHNLRLAAAVGCVVLPIGACHETATPREHFGTTAATTGGRASTPSGGAGAPGSSAGRTTDAGAPHPTSGGTGGHAGTAGTSSTNAASTSTSGGKPDALPQGGDDSSPVGPGGTSEGGMPSGSGGTTASPVDLCGAPPVEVGEFTREGLRRAAVQCANWQFCRFEQRSHALREAVEVEGALMTEPTRAEFRRAMLVWGEIELLQFGPLASKSETAGKDVYQGQGIREFIYAWPSTARCRVEEQLASMTFATRGMDGIPISGRGLYALEYLSHYAGNDTNCAAASSAGQAWAGIVDDLPRRKSAYAVAIAADLIAQTQRLRAIYGATSGGFPEAFIGATGYPSEQEALTVLAWALVYLEREVKDWKLGVPAGYTLQHPVTSPETPFAGFATSVIRANLTGFSRLFQGCGDDGAGLGFDDWLMAAGHAELASDISQALAAARQTADQTPELDRAQPAQIEALYRAIKQLTDILKTDLFGSGSPLNLKLPAGVEGDTD
ncbi:MAG TPA: imelysin family protein [Polyangiaceae bacterium]|nr:imelysin family protein [Polyangiaceae bacterium]